MNLKETMSKMLNPRTTDVSEAAPDALELIHRDHEEVAALFETALSDESTAAQRRNAVKQVVEALTLHAKMEEAIFYPALRKNGKSKEKDSVLEAAEEHGVVKDLIAKIKRIEGRDETLMAKVTVLKEMVEHHVEEEESEMFDEARRVMGDQLDELGVEMQAFKDKANGVKPARKSSNGKSNGSAKVAATRKPADRSKSSRR